jgi:hypothetical protein
VSSQPDSAYNNPELEIDWAAFQAQMEKIVCPQRNAPVPKLPEIDVQSHRIEAIAAATQDMEKIKAVCKRIASDLNSVDVDVLQANPFRMRSTERESARRSSDAIARAESYLELALDEGPNAEQRSREHADVVTRAWDARNAEELKEFEARANELIGDVPAAKTHLEELAEERAQLEQEQEDASLGSQRAFEISSTLLGVENEELSLKLKIHFSEQAASRRELMRQLMSLNRTFSETFSWMWKDTGRMLQAAQRKRQKHSAWRARLRAWRLLAYAFLVVVLGVVTDVALGQTAWAGFWTSLIVAIILWGVDRWPISPWLERRNRHQELRELKEEVAICASTLIQIRGLQIDMDALASYAGVQKVQLLSPALMSLPDL